MGQSESAFPGPLASDTLGQHTLEGSRPPDLAPNPEPPACPAPPSQPHSRVRRPWKEQPSEGPQRRHRARSGSSPRLVGEQGQGRRPSSKAGLMGGESPGRVRVRGPRGGPRIPSTAWGGPSTGTDTRSGLGPGSWSSQEAGGQAKGAAHVGVRV